MRKYYVDITNSSFRKIFYLIQNSIYYMFRLQQPNINYGYFFFSLKSLVTETALCLQNIFFYGPQKKVNHSGLSK